MTDQRTPFDTRLERALGTGSLSPEQRRRHLDRVAERSRAGRFSAGRLIRDGAVVVILIALIAGAWAMLPLGDSSEPETDPMTVLASMRDEIEELAPGEARVMHIGAEINLPAVAGGIESSIKVWERVTTEGEVERSMMSYSMDGELEGRVVETRDEWIVETPGNHQSGPSSEMMTFPPEVMSALPAVYMTTTGGNLSEFLDELQRQPDVEVDYDGALLVISAEIPGGAEEFPDDELSEQFGVPVRGMYIEITLDPEEVHLVLWQALVEDDTGEHHVAQRIELSYWEEIDPADIPDDAFADRTELSEQEIEVPLPERIELSIGTLERSEETAESSGLARFVYVGPAPWLFQIDIYASTGGVDTTDAYEMEIQSTTIAWRSDPSEDWPRSAVWDDGDFRYRLLARNLPEGGWTEDDLYELIEAISEYQQ